MIEKSSMAKSGKSLFILLVFYFLNPIQQLNAQCFPGSLSRQCINNLEQGAIYLKSFNIDGQDKIGDKIEYTTVLSKDTQYTFQICSSGEGADGIILTIYDAKRNAIASNREDKIINPELKYKCAVTGIYYLAFTFFKSSNKCGGCILSFKNSQD